MRTTLTIDDDLVRQLQEEMLRQRKPWKQVVEDVLRRGLSARPAGRKPAPFEVKTFTSGFAPGVDPLRLNQLAGELEDEEYVRIAQRASRHDRSSSPP